MKTIGILTMHAIDNFGSYLQTVALHNYLRDSGYNPTVIDYVYPNQLHLKTGKSHLTINNIQPKMTLGLFVDKIRGRLNMLIFKTAKKRLSRFKAFYDKHITQTMRYSTPEMLIESTPMFDIYIAGSDQIWNPEFVGDDTSFLLSWVPNDKKKISYSSSFSISEIPSQYKETYKKLLQRFDRLSVREESSICKELLGHDVPVTLDPTFLFDKAEWSRYFTNKAIVEGDYIFCYILKYKFNPYPYVIDLINYIKKQTGYKVVFIDGPESLMEKDWNNIRNIGPAEFLNLIYYSKFVITTSFHGTAFSINFEKDFFSLINDQATLDNRQCSILKKLDLEECLLRNNTPLDKVRIPSVDYNSKISIIEDARDGSKNYLRDALKN